MYGLSEDIKQQDRSMVEPYRLTTQLGPQSNQQDISMMHGLMAKVTLPEHDPRQSNSLYILPHQMHDPHLESKMSSMYSASTNHDQNPKRPVPVQQNFQARPIKRGRRSSGIESDRQKTGSSDSINYTGLEASYPGSSMTAYHGGVVPELSKHLGSLPTKVTKRIILNPQVDVANTPGIVIFSIDMKLFDKLRRLPAFWGYKVIL